MNDRCPNHLQQSRGTASLLALLLVLSGACAAGEPGVLETYPGELVEVGGRAMHIHCTGSGHPVTVFESGLGGFSLEWGEVQERIAGHGRACAYDRAGYGWSDPGPMPRTVTRNVNDLHELLVAAGETPPYVLVGHSYGGIIVRLFAQSFPHEVAGIVLLDASAPDQFSRLPDTVLPRALIAAARRGAHMLTAPRLVAALRADVRTTAMHLMMLPKARLAYQSEMQYFESATAQLRAQRDGALDVQLVVVSRSRNMFGRYPEAVRTEYLWQEMQREMAALSVRSDHWMAADSGHVIHADRPDLVALAVREAAEFGLAKPRLPLAPAVRLVLSAHEYVPSSWNGVAVQAPNL